MRGAEKILALKRPKRLQFGLGHICVAVTIGPGELLLASGGKFGRADFLISISIEPRQQATTRRAASRTCSTPRQAPSARTGAIFRGQKAIAIDIQRLEASGLMRAEFRGADLAVLVGIGTVKSWVGHGRGLSESRGRTQERRKRERKCYLFHDLPSIARPATGSPSIPNPAREGN
jgi:hypothetical protein